MITIVIGGQYGSEGKGSVVSWLAQHNQYDLVIRTGSPNAGHTFKALDGTLHKMRQLPCTWAFQDTPIYIPSSAVINRGVLDKEIGLVYGNGYKGDIWVSPQVAVIDEEEARKSETFILTGTTGEGVGYTRAQKCLRRAHLNGDFAVSYSAGDALHILSNRSKNILVETTQGFGLSLDGPNYPYCTSTNLDTYHLLGDAEVPYGVHQIEVWLVMRTFPIRIAGHSGFLFNETSWEKLRAQYGNHIPDEQTTVTKKTRRVGAFDPSLAYNAIKRCGANNLVLTFMDYIFPNIGKTGVTTEISHWLDHLEAQVGAGKKFDYLGVGIGELIPRGRAGIVTNE
jgi:adenylosuccinate synthase